MSQNLKIDLKKRTDQDGRAYFVAKLKGPMSIDCRDGVTFLVFTSDDGDEQLQIAPFQDKQDRQDRQQKQMS